MAKRSQQQPRTRWPRSSENKGALGNKPGAPFPFLGGSYYTRVVAKKRVFITKSPSSTKKLGEILGEEARRHFNKKKTALCFALEGDLGAGKTLFTKGVAHGLGITRTITSPTFVLAKRYPISKSHFRNLWHIDCYRIKKPAELDVLGWKNIIRDPKNILVVEWANQIKKYLPPKPARIIFSHEAPKIRKITFYEDR